jgi:Domain of Unknown Function (DUF748)
MRRRWLWIFGTLALLSVLTYGIARSLDEPLRRYLEREVNHRLTGYTVQIPVLRVHPWIGAFELYGATLVQDAAPDPPVTRIERLVTRIDWRALLHRRLVADITFDRPTVHLDLKNVRTEAASDVALKDRGWQQALEALALDLKINRLRVLDGDVTYVDRGPFKPLHLSRLNLSADNIRNVRSAERVYPSDIHFEGVVFDTGSVWLDGRADFLAEPHPGVAATVRLDEIALDYFKPVIGRYNLSVDRGTLSLAGAVEYAPKVARLALERVLVRSVALEYRHLPRTAEAEQARAQQTAQAAKKVAGKADLDLRIDRLEVADSTFGFANEAARPPYRVVLTDTDFTVEHLGNQRGQGRAAVRLRGQLMGSGETRVTATLTPQTGSADMDLTAQIKGADLARLRDLVLAYGGFDVKAGELSVYSELQMAGGMITGYVKPLLRGVEVGSDEEAAPAKGLRRRLYEGTVGLATKVLKNRSRGEVATVVPISGRVDRPRIGRWDTFSGLLRNAFVTAIPHGLEGGSSPTEDSAPPAATDPGHDTPEAGARRPAIETP